MGQRRPQLRAPRVAGGGLDLARNAPARQLEPFAFLVAVHLLGALARFLPGVGRRLGLLPLLLNRLALEAACHANSVCHTRANERAQFVRHRVAISHSRLARSRMAGRSSTTRNRSATSFSAASVKRPKYASRSW